MLFIREIIRKLIIIYYLTGTGLLMSWEQEQHILVVGGDSNIVRLWDLEQERKIREIHVDKTDNVITALHSKENCEYIIF